ncbi:hypothetical protein NE865_07311 [Phthorimaea operculella]|nr:hypothetical protein NE865_07311 [Phthorimaea operculella]
MQAKQADDKKVRVGVEEEQIKFRPSPNFKNMKKFLKSRSETTLANSVTTAAPIIEQNVTEKVEKKEVKPVVPPPHVLAPAPAVVQPPLPPYPPPASPPLNVTIKQERKDEDDEAQTQSSGEGEPTPPPTTTEPPATEQNHVKQQKKTICKEFIRGNCKRPVCRFAHEVDLDQLRGIFTFCWNYQNDVCTFPNCRFVHASVFEEAEFYRTGILPPHARSHLKNQQTPPGPPTPPPAEMQMSFANPPPPPPHAILEARPEVEEFRSQLPRSISPLKREWSEIDDLLTSPSELDPNEQVAKKCKNCKITDLSLKCKKEKMEDLLQSSEEIKKKILVLNKRSAKLLNILTMILVKTTTSTNSVASSFINTADKDKLMVEQLSSFNVMSVSGNNNLQSLMAKLLCANDQPIGKDSSREA